MDSEEFLFYDHYKAFYSHFLQLQVAVKCLKMVVEQKFKIVRKAGNEIYQNMNSNFEVIKKNSAKFRNFAENSPA